MRLRAVTGTLMSVELNLPGLYRAVILDAASPGARPRARALAAAGAEAGTLVWRPDSDFLDCAVVLQPQETGRKVLPVVLVAALALSDAIGAVGPPGVASDLVWPGAVRVNGGLIGGIGLDLAPGVSLGRIPDWAVVAANIRIAAETGTEGGERPDVTSLEAEGFVGVGAQAVTEAFARYLLVWMDRWQEQDLAPLARHWLHRATARDRDTVLLFGDDLLAGTIEDLDETGCLHLETSRGKRRLTLESWWAKTA